MDTNLLRKWRDIKEKYPDYLILYQVGSFYEMFHEDSEVGHKFLGYQITSRGDGVPFCGMPISKLSEDLARLQRLRVKAVVVDQVGEDESSKLKDRQIRIVTSAGLTLDEDLLEDQAHPGTLCALYIAENSATILAFDIRSASARIRNVPKMEEALCADLCLFNPGEVVLLKGQFSASLKNRIQQMLQIGIEFSEVEASSLSVLDLSSLFGFKISSDGEEMAVRIFHSYLTKCYLQGMSSQISIVRDNISNYVDIDEASYRNLEIEKTLYGGTESKTLFSILDETCTTIGKRILRQWLRYPLGSARKAQVANRLHIVTRLFGNPIERGKLRDLLSRIRDPMSLLTKLSLNRLSVRDVWRLKAALVAVEGIRPLVKNLFSVSDQTLPVQDRAISLIESVLFVDSCGEIVAQVPSSEEAIEASRTLQDKEKWIAAYNERLCKEFPGTKICINLTKEDCLIEVPRGVKLSESYVQVKDLKNKSFYSNPDVQRFGIRLKDARSFIDSLQKESFFNLIEALKGYLSSMRIAFRFIEQIDVLQSFATVAERDRFCCPSFNSDGVIEIREGRHPFVSVEKSRFIPNGTSIGGDDGLLHIVTGPNMAGKSTYLRQVALITLMAHVGSFVPAASANISYVDRIYTRIGASDNIASNQSTFYVEMFEVGNILRNATKDSLVIIDEVGRGTGVVDGYPIAASVCLYIVDKLKCKTLFSTHFHEISCLARIRNSIRNWHMPVVIDPKTGFLIFKYKIEEGISQSSYGMEIAGLAGVPSEVVSLAKELVNRLKFEVNFDIDSEA